MAINPQRIHERVRELLAALHRWSERSQLAAAEARCATTYARENAVRFHRAGLLLTCGLQEDLCRVREVAYRNDAIIGESTEAEAYFETAILKLVGLEEDLTRRRDEEKARLCEAEENLQIAESRLCQQLEEKGQLEKHTQATGALMEKAWASLRDGSFRFQMDPKTGKPFDWDRDPEQRYRAWHITPHEEHLVALLEGFKNREKDIACLSALKETACNSLARCVETLERSNRELESVQESKGSAKEALLRVENALAWADSARRNVSEAETIAKKLLALAEDLMNRAMESLNLLDQLDSTMTDAERWGDTIFRLVSDTEETLELQVRLLEATI